MDSAGVQPPTWWGLSAPAAGLNLGFTPQARRTEVEGNLRRFFKMLVQNSFRSLHSTNAFEHDLLSGAHPAGNLEYRPAGSPLLQAQSRHLPEATLYSPISRFALSVRTADCLPVLLADRRRRVVAAVHAGWRGALAILWKRLWVKCDACSAPTQDILAALGPSIRVCLL